MPHPPQGTQVVHVKVDSGCIVSLPYAPTIPLHFYHSNSDLLLVFPVFPKWRREHLWLRHCFGSTALVLIYGVKPRHILCHFHITSSYVLASHRAFHTDVIIYVYGLGLRSCYKCHMLIENFLYVISLTDMRHYVSDKRIAWMTSAGGDVMIELRSAPCSVWGMHSPSDLIRILCRSVIEPRGIGLSIVMCWAGPQALSPLSQAHWWDC